MKVNTRHACLLVVAITLFVDTYCLSQESAITSPRTPVTDESVGQFLKRVERIAKSGDDATATKLLIEADVEQLAKYHMAKRNPQYIAEFRVETYFPGVPEKFWEKISIKTGAIFPKLHPTEKYANARWEAVYAQRDFTRRFNLVMFHFANGDSKNYKFKVTLEDARKSIFVNEKSWADMPLASRLAIRDLVEAAKSK